MNEHILEAIAEVKEAQDEVNKTNMKMNAALHNLAVALIKDASARSGIPPELIIMLSLAEEEEKRRKKENPKSS